MPIAAAAWVTGIPASIRRHSKSRPAGVNRALRCIEPPLARGLFSDSHTRPEAQLIGGPRQQRPWALQLASRDVHRGGRLAPPAHMAPLLSSTAGMVFTTMARSVTSDQLST